MTVKQKNPTTRGRTLIARLRPCAGGVEVIPVDEAEAAHRRPAKAMRPATGDWTAPGDRLNPRMTADLLEWYLLDPDDDETQD